MARPKKQSEHRSVMMPTDDYWYGNFPNDMAELTFHSFRREKANWVSVWGNDDFGMQSKNLPKGKARRLYRKLKSMKVINQKMLRELGFENS